MTVISISKRKSSSNNFARRWYNTSDRTSLQISTLLNWTSKLLSWSRTRSLWMKSSSIKDISVDMLAHSFPTPTLLPKIHLTSEPSTKPRVGSWNTTKSYSSYSRPNLSICQDYSDASESKQQQRRSAIESS